MFFPNRHILCKEKEMRNFYEREKIISGNCYFLVQDDYNAFLHWEIKKEL